MDTTRRRLDDLRATARSLPERLIVGRGSRPARLEEVLGGREATWQRRRFWCVETPFGAVSGQAGIREADFAAARQHEAGDGLPLLIEPRRAMVVDIETGGFAGMPVFLIGLVLLDRRPLSVLQFLARDYPEEEAILGALSRIARRRDTWITFNGKSFDAPFLLDRACIHRVDLTPARLHVDVLHAARRRWRHRLPDCRLGTLEARILKRPRVGDVPSSDVPDLFHHFMHTGNAGPLRPVLEHNRIDLVSSTELLVRLSEPAP